MSRKTLAALILISLFTYTGACANFSGSGSLLDASVVQGPQVEAPKVLNAYNPQADGTGVATGIQVGGGDPTSIGGTPMGLPSPYQTNTALNWKDTSQTVANAAAMANPMSPQQAQQMHMEQMLKAQVPGYAPYGTPATPSSTPYGTTTSYPYGAAPTAYPYGAPSTTYPYGTPSTPSSTPYGIPTYPTTGYTPYAAPVGSAPYPYTPPVNGIGGMSPTAPPVPGMGMGALAIPGMGIYGPQAQQMYRNQQLKAMGYNEQLDPATKKAILDQAASTFRLVASMSNESLANEDISELKKWRQHLRQLTKLPESKLSEFITKHDEDDGEETRRRKKDKSLKDLVSEQLDRISTAIRDPETLRSDPDAKTMPETEYKEDHREAVYKLIDKWKTPHGLKKGKRHHSTQTSKNASRGSGVASYTKLRKIDQQVEEATNDQRILSEAYEGALKNKAEDYASRIERALYNIYVAKGRLYDGFMDMLTPPILEGIIDRIRNGGALPRPKSTHTHKGSRKGRSKGRSHDLSNYNPGLDELQGDIEAIDSVIDELEKKKDRATGTDLSLIRQLKTNVARLKRVIEAVHNPTMKNPFRGLSEAAKEALEDYKVISAMPLGTINVESDEDDQRKPENKGTLVGLSDDQLTQYKSTFQNVVNSPAGNISPRMPFSEALDSLDRVTKVLALLLLSEMDTTSDKISASKMRGKKKVRGLSRGDSQEGLNQLVNYLQWGYFYLGPQIGADIIDSNDVRSTISRVNTYFIEKKAGLFKKSAAADTKVEQRDRRQAAQRSLESLGENMGAPANDLMKKVRNLNGIYDNIQTYYNFGYYKDIPIEKEDEKEKKTTSKKRKRKSSHHSIWGHKKAKKSKDSGNEDGYDADTEEDDESTSDKEETTDKKGAETEAEKDDPIQEVLNTPAHLQDLLQRLAEARYLILKEEYPAADLTEEKAKEDIENYVTLLKQYRMLLASGFLSPQANRKVKKTIKQLISILDVAAAESE